MRPLEKERHIATKGVAILFQKARSFIGDLWDTSSGLELVTCTGMGWERTRITGVYVLEWVGNALEWVGNALEQLVYMQFYTILQAKSRLIQPIPYTGKFWRPLNLAKWPEMARYKFGDFKIWRSHGATEKYDVTMRAVGGPGRDVTDLARSGQEAGRRRKKRRAVTVMAITFSAASGGPRSANSYPGGQQCPRCVRCGSDARPRTGT